VVCRTKKCAEKLLVTYFLLPEVDLTWS